MKYKIIEFVEFMHALFVVKFKKRTYWVLTFYPYFKIKNYRNIDIKIIERDKNHENEKRVPGISKN